MATLLQIENLRKFWKIQENPKNFLEAIHAGRMQERHPNPCRLAPSGYFGSKFVTVVVTGNDKGEIDFRGYQISNQVMKKMSGVFCFFLEFSRIFWHFLELFRIFFLLEFSGIL